MNTRTRRFCEAALVAMTIVLASACNKKPEPVAVTPAPPQVDAAALEAEAKDRAMVEFKRHWTNVNHCWYAYTASKQHIPVMTNVTLKALPAELDDEMRQRGVKWIGEVEFQTDATRTFHFSTRQWTDWKPLKVPMAYALLCDSNGEWRLNNEFTNFTRPTPLQLRAALSAQ